MFRLLLLSLILIISCDHLRKKSNQTRYFDRTAYHKHLFLEFCVIVTPTTWMKVNNRSFRNGAGGTNRGKIQIGPSEFIDYSIGWDIADLSKESNEKYKTWYGQISGYKAKMYQPIQMGLGYTGLYIDSVSTAPGTPTVGVAFYAKNLDSLMNTEFLEAIKSIKLRIYEY